MLEVKGGVWEFIV